MCQANIYIQFCVKVYLFRLKPSLYTQPIALLTMTCTSRVVWNTKGFLTVSLEYLSVPTRIR